MKHAGIILLLSLLAASPARSAEDPLPSVPRSERVALPLSRTYQEYGSGGSFRDFLVELFHGQVLSVTLADDSGKSSSFRATVYRLTEKDPGTVPGKLVGETVEGVFLFEPEETGSYIVRLDKEEIAGGKAVLTLAAGPILLFPVQGKKNTRLVSLFGDGRDEGARFHEGIDIRAPRATPVVAAADGTVRKVGRTEKGGNVISVWDPVRRLSYYYAHLETQDIEQGKKVKAGDRLGTVGNSGNASGTFPHLHFTVYTEKWKAIDPLYFVYPPEEASLK